MTCPNVLERDTFDYSQEEAAYRHFMEHVGFFSAAQKIKDLLLAVKDEYEKIYIIGFSIGATVAWLCGEEDCVDGIVGYYGSRIRDYLELTPQCPVMLFFPQEEQSFNVDELLLALEKRILVYINLQGNMDSVILIPLDMMQNQNKKHLAKRWNFYFID